MTQPIEKNLLQTFRLFLGLRLALSSVGYFLVRQSGGLLDVSVVHLVITAGILLYLSLPILQKILRQFYLPIGLAAVTLHLLIEQRLTQLRVAQIDFPVERDIPNMVESFIFFIEQLLFQLQVTTSVTIEQNLTNVMEPAALPIVENIAFPLLLTLGTTALLFVPLVLLSLQYNFRSVFLFVVATTLFDLSLLIVLNQYAQFDVPIEFLGINMRNVAFLIVGFIVTRIMNTQREQRAQLEAVNRQLAAYATTREQLFVTQERNRLARELHDTLAHTMSAVTVKLNAVNVLWENNPQRAQTMLDEVIATLSDGNDETRRALRDLRASPLDDMGFVLAIRTLAESAAQRGNFALDLQTPTQDLRLSPDSEQAIYRIAQESLANIVEHAEASHVSFVMTLYDTFLKLTIRDNGVGFPLADSDHYESNGHFGLLGMRERAAMINAELTIDSQEGVGTAISLTVSLTRHATDTEHIKEAAL